MTKRGRVVKIQGLTHMNKASRSKVQRLLDILQCAHDRANNLQPLQCEHQRWRARYDSRVLRQADRDERAARPQETRRTLVPLPRGRRDNDAVRTVRRQRHHLRRNVLARGKVDIGLGAESLAQVSLLVATVDGNHTHAHRLGILDREVA